MLRKTWVTSLMLALQTVYLDAAIIPTDSALLQPHEQTPSSPSPRNDYHPPTHDFTPATPPQNATHLLPNLTAPPIPPNWTAHITTGLRLAQTAFPGAYPVSIHTYSCDSHDYPYWHYLDCYAISLSGPTSTSAVSIAGRWDQLHARAPWWDAPVHLPGRRGAKARVPWPPFVGLEVGEGLARGMGYVRGYHAVELEGVVGEGGSCFYKFSSREGGSWHVSFHDGFGGVGREGVSGGADPSEGDDPAGDVLRGIPAWDGDQSVA